MHKQVYDVLYIILTIQFMPESLLKIDLLSYNDKPANERLLNYRGDALNSNKL